VDDLSAKKLWTSQDLADFWGVSVNVVSNAARAGRIPGCSKTTVGGYYRFDREVVIREWTPKSMKGWLEHNPEGKLLIRRTAEERMDTLSVTVSQDNWVQVIRKAISQAIGGDYRARQWLSNYLLGPPIQRLLAKVEVKEVVGFEDDFRAAAIKTLLDEVRSRAEADIVDVTPEEVEDDPEGI